MNESEKILKKIRTTNTELIAERKNLQFKKTTVGAMTGFADLDYFIGGIRAGWYYVLSGATGHGKTTLVRQIVLALVQQKFKPYMFIGEESLLVELRNMARINATDAEINRVVGLAGRFYFEPTPERFEAFCAEMELKGLVAESYYDLTARASQIGLHKPLYELVLMEMEAAYRKGSRVFIVDNLSRITEDFTGKQVFDAQKKAVNAIQKFVKKKNTPVILVTHPNKTGDQVSGISEIQNHADCVLYLRRFVEDKDRERYTKGMPFGIAADANGMLFVVKAREDGILGRVPLQWDEKNGQLINLSTGQRAQEYQDMGWPTKYCRA